MYITACGKGIYKCGVGGWIEIQVIIMHTNKSGQWIYDHRTPIVPDGRISIEYPIIIDDLNNIIIM